MVGKETSQSKARLVRHEQQSGYRLAILAPRHGQHFKLSRHIGLQAIAPVEASHAYRSAYLNRPEIDAHSVKCEPLPGLAHQTHHFA